MDNQCIVGLDWSGVNIPAWESDGIYWEISVLAEMSTELTAVLELSAEIAEEQPQPFHGNGRAGTTGIAHMVELLRVEDRRKATDKMRWQRLNNCQKQTQLSWTIMNQTPGSVPAGIGKKQTV